MIMSSTAKLKARLLYQSNAAAGANAESLNVVWPKLAKESNAAATKSG